MKYLGTKRIETSRLILRPFTMQDVEAAYRNWCADDDVTKFLRWPSHQDVSVTKQVIGDWVKRYTDLSFYHWAIELRDLQEPIGSIGVVRLDERIDMVHIGYCLGKTWWHQGIMTEAFQAVIAFLFQEVEVNRIEAQHDRHNPHSGQVMKKCGMTYEGTLRQADYNNQGIVDVRWYGLLREDYGGLQNEA